MKDDARRTAFERKLKEIEDHLRRLERQKRYKDQHKDEVRRRDRERWRKKHPNGVGRGRWREPEPVINDKNEEFVSAKAAGDAYGVNRNSIIYACQNPNRICCGHRWGWKKNGRPHQWDESADLKNYPHKRKLKGNG